jgi:hypothetical protein
VGEDVGEHRFDLHQAGFTERGAKSDGGTNEDHHEGTNLIYAGASGVGLADGRDEQFGSANGSWARSR